jgi:hypothetical protein
VIVDVSQTIQDFSKKAKDYLTKSNGCMQYAMGLDSSYRGSPHRLTIHVWTSTISTEHGTTTYGWMKSLEDEICNGDQVNSGKAAIPLKAFGLPGALALTYPNADLHAEIVFSYNELATCLSRAVRAHTHHELLVLT